MTKERRNRAVRIAEIVIDGSPMRCKVRYLTTSSAIVQTLHAPFMPAVFGLRIPSVGHDFYCSVIWRDERRLCVTFLN